MTLAWVYLLGCAVAFALLWELTQIVLGITDPD